MHVAFLDFIFPNKAGYRCNIWQLQVPVTPCDFYSVYHGASVLDIMLQAQALSQRGRMSMFWVWGAGVVATPESVFLTVSVFERTFKKGETVK